MSQSDRAALLQAARNGDVTQQVCEQFPIYPLTAPGMPIPGEDFLKHAVAMGDPAPVFTTGKVSERQMLSHGPRLDYLIRRALYDELFTLPVETAKGDKKTAQLVPGHLLGDDTGGMRGGPRSSKVMILSKAPGREETAERRCMVGPSSDIFFDALDEIGVGSERADYYVDHLVKWGPLDDSSDSIPTSHKKDCDILLQQTLRLVRPDYLLCLGSEASKWVLGTEYGVSSMVGRMVPMTIPLNPVAGQDTLFHTVKVMAATHPAAVYRTPELYPEFRQQLGMFIGLTNGGIIGEREKFINHRTIYRHAELKKIVDEILADPDPLRRIISLDGEWEGEHPENKNAYLRTVQFSTKHGEGICVVLRHQGGTPAFFPTTSHAIYELNRLCKAKPGYSPQLGGHFFRADLPWLIHAGIDIREEYRTADKPELCRTVGGWDTGAAYHAYNETGSYSLTDMMVRLTQAPVYDVRLNRHVDDYCRRNGMKRSDIEGYGFLPAWILHPNHWEPEWGDNYAQYDPDVTRRIIMRHFQPDGFLDKDQFGNASWEPYWRTQRAALGVLEMEMNGIKLDKGRIDELTTLYVMAKEQLLNDFRKKINWPGFNPESPQQCVAFLFGDRFSMKLDKTTGQHVNIRPPGAMTLNLTPIKTTGKRSKLWADVVARGESHAHAPSTDKEVLGIIGHAHPLAMQLRDMKFIAQITKGPLRPPVVDTAGAAWAKGEDGHLQYDRGLASEAQSDGRVHTHISANKETGRASSSRPPLQNLSKRREGDYSRILGTWRKDPKTGQLAAKGDYTSVFPTPLYRAPIRTIFKASEGHVLVEVDYTGAELAVIAWLANDANMIEHVRRNILPEDHPDHYDIHSHTAVDTFQLQCAPTKKGLKEAGFSPLRVAAKNVNFGIPYGRSAEAITRQCKEEGVDVSEDDCQRMIEGYFIRYPGTAAFLKACELRTQNERWMAGPFGRFRRFVPTRDRAVIGEQQRQGKNFPIQNAVADAAWTAIYNFHEFKRNNPSHHFRMLLQIHDALLFEVPIPELDDFVNNVMRRCMIDEVPIWPRYLNNTPMHVEQPYHFGVDYEIQLNWGEDISHDEAVRLGINPALVA